MTPENCEELKVWLAGCPLDSPHKDACNNVLGKMVEIEKRDIAERVAEILNVVPLSRFDDIGSVCTFRNLIFKALTTGDTTKLEEWCR